MPRYFTVLFNPCMHQVQHIYIKCSGLSCKDESAAHNGFNFILMYFSITAGWRVALFMHHWQGASCCNRCCWRLVVQFAWQCCYCSQADKTVVDYVFCCNAACGVQLLWRIREFRFITTWFRWFSLIFFWKSRTSLGMAILFQVDIAIAVISFLLAIESGCLEVSLPCLYSLYLVKLSQ